MVTWRRIALLAIAVESCRLQGGREAGRRGPVHGQPSLLMIEPIARVRIELREIEPTLWRRIDVPLTSTLLALHDIIQVTVGWTDSHLFEFVVGDRVYSDPLPDDEFFERKINAAGIRLRTLIMSCSPWTRAQGRPRKYVKKGLDAWSVI